MPTSQRGAMDEDQRRQFGAALGKIRRLKYRETQDEFAQRIGSTIGTVAYLETGRHCKPFDNVQGVLSRLGYGTEAADGLAQMLVEAAQLAGKSVGPARTPGNLPFLPDQKKWVWEPESQLLRNLGFYDLKGFGKNRAEGRV